MMLFVENRNSIDITGTLLALLVPENTVFRCSKLKVGTKVGTVMEINRKASIDTQFCALQAQQ